MRQRILIFTAIGALVLSLPLLGARLAGRDLRELFTFPPPLEIPSQYPAFSWLAAAAVVIGLALVFAPWLRRRPGRVPSTPAAAAMPAWGWLSLAWTLGWWLLAWTRFEWFAALQKYTFFPLWLGFIVFLNALIHRRTGSCPMRQRTGEWLVLFAASAVCWWGFEWLNRFVRNWHYLNVQDFSAPGYALHATLCFSTVLPAVSAVAELLAAQPRWTSLVRNGPAWPWLARRSTAWLLLGGGVVALIATGALPTWFYPALWVAPLGLAIAAEVFLARPGLSVDVSRGDWRGAATWMFAALVCGGFWEMWNWHSLAKWIYTVPGVERWFIFEMPLLGYAGYLPFGLECYFATRAVAARPVAGETPTAG